MTIFLGRLTAAFLPFMMAVGVVNIAVQEFQKGNWAVGGVAIGFAGAFAAIGIYFLTAKIEKKG